MNRRRWTSRKFITAMIGQIVGILILLFPAFESEIAQASQHVTALLLMGLTAFGYIRGEAQTDAASIKANSEMEMTREHTRDNRMREEHKRQQWEHERKQAESATETGRVAPMLALALTLPLLAGCASNPVDRYLELQHSVNTTRSMILTAHDVGWISDRELVTLDSYEKAVRDTMTSVRERLPRDEEGNLDPDGEMDEASIEDMLATAERMLDRLTARYEEMADDAARDSDDPSGSEGGSAGDEGVLRLDRHRDRTGQQQWHDDAGAAPRDRGGDSRLAA